MSKRHLKFLRNEVIDDVTAGRIREYEAKANVTVALPVPLEQIVEQVLGLDFDWDVIEEHPGEQILGGLDAVNKKILLNEKHVDLFDSKPGLLRSTIGHEAGHYDIDIDRSKLLHPKLPGIDFKAAIANRHASKADRLIEVLLDRAVSDPRAMALYKKITAGQDTAEQKSAVDRYQSALWFFVIIRGWFFRLNRAAFPAFRRRTECGFDSWRSSENLVRRPLMIGSCC